jgi:HTH-type transcriptional regulator/antitoxin HigA
MEEKGLRQKDIADLLGGRNRASEVLSRKRPLTLPMIRALYEQLDIPPALLVKEPKPEYSPGAEIQESDVPLEVLRRRGWVEDGVTAKQLLARLTAPASHPLLLRHTQVFGSASLANRSRIQLWLARVREIADARDQLRGRYRKDCLSFETLRYLSRLSWMPDGPRLAVSFLADRGIALVIEPHLPSTRLDGAAMIGRSGAPVIGLTLRQDRLDNFWFTLMHELVHAWKHLDAERHRAIVDENIETNGKDISEIEREANEIAAEILIDREAWQASQVRLSPSASSIQEFATRMQVSPAIVAGRVRHERGNYALFSKLVGVRAVRAMFPEVSWS